jgi:hypothetical protein
MVAVCAALAGCAPADMRMDVLVQRYPGVLFTWENPKLGADCKATILPEGSKPPNGCFPVGDVFFGDTGRTTLCNKESVEKRLRDELCLLRAEYGVSRHLRDGISTCYQLRAIAYRCPAPEEASAP